MKKLYIIFLLLFILANHLYGQKHKVQNDTLGYWSDIELADDSIFWNEFFYKDYFELPFYVWRDSLGYYKNNWSDQPLTKDDTIPHLITAQGICNGKGYHIINEGEAIDLNDTIVLYIGESSPAYYDDYLFKIVNGKFKGSYNTVYKHYRYSTKLFWKTFNQKLYLNMLKPQKGTWLKGKVEYDCLQIDDGGSRLIHLTSYFKLRVE
ncbi:MAG: hypothetical protein SGJ10_12645 [Bacteroidota bacterium]|nr:hypothetical protein [Bacteroidota bacterium]